MSCLTCLCLGLAILYRTSEASPNTYVVVVDYFVHKIKNMGAYIHISLDL